MEINDQSSWGASSASTMCVSGDSEEREDQILETIIENFGEMHESRNPTSSE